MTRIGPFEVLAQLSEGAMATVYIAQRRTGAFRKKVALKVLKPELRADPIIRELFTEEARILRQTTHEGLCRVFESETSGSTPYIAMEWVRGPSLARLIENLMPYDEGDARYLIAIVQRSAEALAHLHEASDVKGRSLEIVHRDFGAENIVIGRDGYPRLIDFGVSRHAGRPSLTRTGVLRGRLANCAPETFAGSLTQRSDVWALGLLAWRICVQESPWDETDPAEVVYAIQNEPILPPTARGGHGDEMLDATILRALDRDPEKRTPTAMAFAAALRMWLDTQGGNPRPNELAQWLASKPQIDEPPPLITRRRSRSNKPVWLIAASLLIVTAAAAGFVLTGLTPPPAPAASDPEESSGRERSTTAFAPRRGIIVTEEPSDSTHTPPTATAGQEPAERHAAHRRRRKSTARLGSGNLNIVTIGAWAEVHINGRRLGQTPLTSTLPAGTHTLDLFPEGKPPALRRTVQIEKDGRHRLVVRTH